MNNKMVIVSVQEYFTQLKKLVATPVIMVKTKQLDKQFIERIMLAVSQVNGCSICSYEHTKIAFKAGISQDEIDELLNGTCDNIPDDQKLAVIFAQHYAYTRGNPEDNALFKLRAYYGREKAQAIIKVIDIIMFGNSYGIAWLNFKDRVHKKPIKKSRLSRELIILATPLLLAFFPIIIGFTIVRLLKKQVTL